jgi:hypothetical protein
MKLLFAISALVLATSAKDSILTQLKQLEHAPVDLKSHKTPAAKKDPAADAKKASDMAKKAKKAATAAKKAAADAKKSAAVKKAAAAKR